MKNAEQSPILDGLDRPFYEAVNEGRLVLQYCAVDDRWQQPPEPACGGACGSADSLEWRQTDGSGTSYGYPVVHDTPIASPQPDQPFNRAVIELDDFPSHPSGQPAEGTPATGQKEPGCRVAESSNRAETHDERTEAHDIPAIYTSAAGLYRTADDPGVWPHRGKVAAVGVGHSPTLRRWDGDPQKSIGAWAILAIRKAIEDAGVDPAEVDGLVFDPRTPPAPLAGG